MLVKVGNEPSIAKVNFRGGRQAASRAGQHYCMNRPQPATLDHVELKNGIFAPESS
jgi:hypothetical protein